MEDVIFADDTDLDDDLLVKVDLNVGKECVLEDGRVDVVLVVLFIDEEVRLFLGLEGEAEKDSFFVDDAVEDDLVEDRFVKVVVFAEDEDLPEVETLIEEDETFGDVREVCKDDLEERDESCGLL